MLSTDRYVGRFEELAQARARFKPLLKPCTAGETPFSARRPPAGDDEQKSPPAIGGEPAPVRLAIDFSGYRGQLPVQESALWPLLAISSSQFIADKRLVRHGFLENNFTLFYIRAGADADARLSVAGRPPPLSIMPDR